VTSASGFQSRYAAALLRHLTERDEPSLAAGYELGRQALLERISVLEIIESHFRLFDDASINTSHDDSAALQFLLQTLAPLDVAIRGFLDGTRRYEEQRARADDLADRDAFRSALVNSLQEGFFVADRDGTVIEINAAFAEVTGYGADGLPYPWRHPWVVDAETANEQLIRLEELGSIAYETPIRHRNGHLAWVAISINAVTEEGADRDVYVGTIRDITGARASAVRDNAVVRLATGAGVARSVAEVLAILFEECRMAIDLRRVVAVTWPKSDGEPAIQVAGEPSSNAWRDLDPSLRAAFEDARNWPPLRVEVVHSEDNPGKSRGIVAVLSGAEDIALWLEHNTPRRIGADDRLLVMALVGHLSLAMHHVQQFETAREASLTLQRAMLPTTQPPQGFAVRYEPAVPPLEIGGDWYDVLEIGDRHIGIVVGDCVGRGLPAAATMGQLRSSARALMLTGAEPAQLLEALDSAAELIAGADCATVFLGLLDTESGTLRYSSAGHLPALIASPDSAPILLTAAGSVPLAVQRSNPRPQASAVLPPGSTLMLFTDGLVERKEQSIDAGIDRVAQVLTEMLGAPAEEVADAVLRELAPLEGYDDDVAIVVHRRPPSPLRISAPAIPKQLSAIRAELTDWLHAVGAPDALVADVVLAGNEACTNSIEHAYRGGDAGTMRVEARVGGAEIELRIVDFGTWKTPPEKPDKTRGRGLPLMRAVSDRIDVVSSESGTTVEMRFGLPLANGVNGLDAQRAAENARSDST
jgi:PAS domain S-box-containing protein